MFGQPDRSFVATELIGLIGFGSGAVQRELRRLTDSDLITVTRIGGSRPSQSGDGYSGIDVTKPADPIRGSWTKYRCTNVKTYPGVGANNCNVWDETDGSGICYRTTFGDWRCMMFSRANTMRTGLVPPPR